MAPTRIKISLLLLLTVTSLGVMAQNNFQPYSQFGIGEVDDNFYNRTSGLSNTGIAYRSNRYLINNNPAALSGLANQYFSMETAIRGQFIDYTGTPVAPASTQSGDITFRRLAMGIKITKNWGSSIGLAPYATQNYEFNTPYYIQGTANENANHLFQGHGSVNKAYWSNGYEFFHHLSIGVEAAYMFGQLNQKDIIQNLSNGASLASTENDINLQNIYMTYGLQAYTRIGKHWSVTVGGTYSQKNDLLASYNKIVLGSDSIPLQSGQLSEGYLSVPNSYGAGISVSHNDRYTWLADYRYQDWGALKKNSYPSQGYTIGSSERGSLGFEVSKTRIFFNTRVEVSYLQAGLYYGKSYLQINGKQIDDKGVTLGFGINTLKNPSLGYSVVFQYGIKGTTDNNLIRENYANLTFVINYGSIWFTKGKKFE